MEANNMAAMREALVIAKRAICHHAKYTCQSLAWENSTINANCGDILCAHRDLCEAKTAIHKALAAPQRNCDVGTVKDQTERFEAFCQSNMQFYTDMFGRDAEGRLDGWDCRDDCPVGRMIDSGTAVSDRCQLAWAQMPYEEKEGTKAEAQMDADGGDNKEMRHE